MEIIYYPILDSVREKAQFFENQIKQDNSNGPKITNNINEANIILVGGGDGFLLDTISQYHHLNKIFLGINCGTRGFLLNDIANIEELPKYTNEIEIIEEKFIKTETITNNKCVVRYAVNDIVIGNNLGSMFSISFRGNTFSYEISGTGAIVTNNIGSTGYWLSGGGPLIPLKTDLWGIMGIFCLPFNYDIINPQEIIIETISRYPTHVWVDGKSGLVENINKIKLSPTENSFRLGFLDFKRFETKRLTLYKEKLGVRNINI